MSYDITNDAEQPPGQPVPGISSANLRRVRNVLAIVLGLLFLFLFLWWLRVVYTDWTWASHVGYGSVYSKILWLKVWLFIGGTLVAAGALAANFYFAHRFSRGPSTLPVSNDALRLFWALVAAGVAIAIISAAPTFGSAAESRWETFLLFFNKVSFGLADPEFGRDVSFYVVTLRLLHFIQGWFMAILIVCIVLSLLLYGAVYGIRNLSFIVAPRMLRHVAVLGALLMLILAAGHALGVYELVLSPGGLVAGATYADIHARVPVLWLMTGIAVLAAAGFAVSPYYGGLRLMLGSFSLWVIMALLANLAFPALFQRFQVAPNEFTKEEVYIQRNIEATRAAFQLDQLREIAVPRVDEISADVVAGNPSIIDNIRLWDAEPLQDVYNQVQFMELYYNFLNMDSDRYQVDGELRQVMLAARELDAQNLPADARNWVNHRLQYTHGFGVAMSSATGFTPDEGKPEFLVKDIPIRGKFPITRPEIYYGESPAGFAIVNTERPEINPQETKGHYQGNGGILLDSTLRRLAYAWQFADINILLSDQLTPDSRLQYRREVGNRVKAIAPFLEIDADPYPVIDNNGKLWWLQDAFTTTSRYPYSTQSPGGFNYIRNSVKAVVDAYNGDVSLYVMDTEDPLLKMYRRAFPDLLREFSEMPEDLKEHIRYPHGMFASQAGMYLRYHITDPQVFFNQAQQWAIPLETRFGQHGVPVTPAYLILQMPGETEPEFVLMLPFTPAGEKKNLVGWLVARNDPDHYGELLSFRVPGDPQVDGPSQVEARIENDQSISQQFTLWEGAGSRIIRGKLLVIPVGDAIIYVEPLYLQSEVLAFPELKKIILADSGNVVMADSVSEGLAMLRGGGAPPTTAGAGGDGQGSSSGAVGGGPTAEDLDRIEKVVSQLDDVIKELQGAVERLRESLQQN